jgi:hypothetical protein
MIEVENLSKVYGSEYSEPAVRGVSFRVGKGEIVGFLGPQRRGQDDNDAHPHLLHGAFSGHGAYSWPRHSG